MTVLHILVSYVNAAMCSLEPPYVSILLNPINVLDDPVRLPGGGLKT